MATHHTWKLTGCKSASIMKKSCNYRNKYNYGKSIVTPFLIYIYSYILHKLSCVCLRLILFINKRELILHYLLLLYSLLHFIVSYLKVRFHDHIVSVDWRFNSILNHLLIYPHCIIWHSLAGHQLDKGIISFPIRYGKSIVTLFLIYIVTSCTSCIVCAYISFYLSIREN